MSESAFGRQGSQVQLLSLRPLNTQVIPAKTQVPAKDLGQCSEVLKNRKPRALDLFCCSGGAGMGLHRAGFDVVGVDIEHRPRYPFAFVQADAMTYPLDGFDFIWASPPCQGYTDLRHAKGAVGAPRLIGPVRDRLMAAGVPWCIENVDSPLSRAEMRDPVTLCGSMFGLGAQGHRLERHRLFESSFPIPRLECRHSSAPVIGVYGGHARCRSAKHGGRGTKDVWEGGHRSAASEAMGMDWATLAEMSEAIPPAYAEYIGLAALAHLQRPKAPL